jgi:hypothetical protein
LRRISKLEARIGKFFDSSPQKLNKNGHHLSCDASELELARFVDPDHNQNLSISDTPESVSASAALLPWWLAVGGLAALFVLALWVPPEGKSEPVSLSTARLVGCAVVSVFVLMSFYMVNAIQKTKGTYFIFDKLNRTLELPRYGITIADDQVHSFFILCAPTLSRGRACELSILVRIDQTGLVRYSLGIDGSRKKIQRLGKALAEHMSVSLATLKLNRKKRKALGLNWKDVWNFRR